MATPVIAVDTGGTFTDIVFVTRDGKITVQKYSGTPGDPSQSVINGIKSGLDQVPLDGGFELCHGTTVATNALLEGTGSRCALITTKGFRDVLEIARQNRTDLYSLNPVRRKCLIESEHRYELSERVDWQGRAVCELTSADTEQLVSQLHDLGYESVAVSFLFSYLNNRHELHVGDALRRAGMMASLSHEVAPEPREYERSATTAANALVAPILSKYLTRLEAGSMHLGALRLRIMQSNGGTLSAAEAGQFAIRTALSGPAGGVVASIALGSAVGIRDLITFDMGGTSTDVALIRDGVCPVVNDGFVADIPLRTPMYDIHTVGAGGGSIARLDVAGVLHVGPQSAGARPGPAAYGHGDSLTVTDANVVLGRIPADVPLGGTLRIDAARATQLFLDFASRLKCTFEEAASGVIEVANQSMIRAIRHVSTERGEDPAQYTLLCYGGAGGLHACAIGEALGIARILVPRYPGAFSAIGLALAPVSREFSMHYSAHTVLDSSMASALNQSVAKLHAEAKIWMNGEGLEFDQWLGRCYLDLRYSGQSHDLRLELPLPVSPVYGEHSTDIAVAHSTLDIRQIIASFHTAHKSRYGHADSSQSVELVAVRYQSISSQRLSPFTVEDPPNQTPACSVGSKLLYTGNRWVQAPHFMRAELSAGQKIAGPAIISQNDSTLFIDDNWIGATDVSGNITLIPTS